MCAVWFSTENQDGKKTKGEDIRIFFKLYLFLSWPMAHFTPAIRPLFIGGNSTKQACSKAMNIEMLCFSFVWPEKEIQRGTPDVFSSSSCSALSQNIPAKSVPLHEGTHTNPLNHLRSSTWEPYSSSSFFSRAWLGHSSRHLWTTWRDDSLPLR